MRRISIACFCYYSAVNPTSISNTIFVQAMNWTGGSLQRTKKANAGILERQKAYFAKARANPQNTPQMPATPFCPSFLRDDDKLGPGGLASFDSYSVRRGERSMTSGGGETLLQREHQLATRKNKWSAISGRGVSPREVSSRRVTHHQVHSETPPLTQQDLRSSKRKAPDTDVEIQLLDANKKRLLTQVDWIGVNPSKPVSLSSLACKQNEKINRHRITNGRCNLAKRQHDNGKCTQGDADLQHRTISKPFHGHTRCEKPEDIRIRIGMDALTDDDLPRTEGYAESEGCSDTMLFEQDRRLTGQPVEQRGSEPSMLSQHDVAVSAGEHDDLFPQISAISKDAPQSESISGRMECISNKGVRDKLLTQQQSPLTRMTADEAQSPGFGFRLVDRAQGDEYSLRLVFSGSSDCSEGARTYNHHHHHLGVTDGQETCKTRLLGKLEPTWTSQTERVHRVTSNDSEGRGAYAIVDQEPGIAYFAISDDCPKPYDAGLQTRRLLQLDDPDARNKSGVVANWSQCATQGQGDGQCFDTLSRSDAPVFLRRGDVGNSMTEWEAEIDADRQSKSNAAAHVQTLDEEEKKWQAFIFG